MQEPQRGVSDNAKAHETTETTEAGEAAETMLIHSIPKDWLKAIRLLAQATGVPAAFIAAVVCQETGITVNGYPNKLATEYNNLTSIGGAANPQKFKTFGLSIVALIYRVGCHHSMYPVSQNIFDHEGVTDAFIDAFAAMYAAPDEADDWASCVKKYVFAFGPEFAQIGDIV